MILNNKTMIQILVQPTIENLYEDFDGTEEDEDALLFEQGFQTDSIPAFVQCYHAIGCKKMMISDV